MAFLDLHMSEIGLLLFMAIVGALFMAIVVYKLTVVCRVRVPRRRVVNHALTAADPDPSTSEAPSIFLCHSGCQKPFVEHLYDALQRANHTPFFDTYSLPDGSAFPPRIFHAAHGCKLGVVVLSEEFLISKWPMLELEILVLERGPEPPVLPLFYQLHPDDFKSPTNLSRWRRAWKKNAGGQDAADKWERAVKQLKSFKGATFVQKTSEVAYMRSVVGKICALVPSPAPYVIPLSIQGQKRLAEEVARKFECVDGCGEALMVGLHGVPGLGKTTVCKIVANFYDSKYDGKSYIIEFPMDGDDKKIMKQCKKALQKLTGLSKEHVLDLRDSFDQVIPLMKKHLQQYDVFIAIDNVSPKSLEAAKEILKVKFSAKSKILLTSQSEPVLIDLLMGHNNASLGPLPTPTHAEAIQIFKETLELDDLDSLEIRKQLDIALERCKFRGEYHPQIVKTLGQKSKIACTGLDLKKREQHLSMLLEETSDLDVQELIEGVRLMSYDELTEDKQHMFLDIAVLIIQDGDELTDAKALQWLSVLYRKSSKTISRLINELAFHGLIDLEGDEPSERTIRVHELYYELAQEKAKKSSRFLTDKSEKMKIKWKRLGRVILRGDDRSQFIEKLQQEECQKLEVLYAVDKSFSRGINLCRMPSLCILKLKNVALRSIENWSAATDLAIVQLLGLDRVQPWECISGLEELLIKTEDGCWQLKTLVLVNREECLKASCFNFLTNLVSLHIEGPGFTQLSKLEVG